MVIRLLWAVIAALFIVSCQNNNNSSNEEYSSRYFEDGRSKPIVTVVPVIDSTTYEVSWSLAEEFSSLIRQKLSRNGTIYLEQTKETTTPLPLAQNPFSSNISWMKDVFHSSEFVVFAELVEHVNIPTEKTSIERIMEAEKLKEISSNLNMGIRIRIVDLRLKEPKIILQELLKDSYFISKSHIDTDYSLIIWGMDEYITSPMGMAHNQLSKEVAERIEDYVILSKSR